MPRSIASNQASIMSVRSAGESEPRPRRRNSELGRGHGQRLVAPAVEHGIGGDERRERHAQLVESHLVRGDFGHGGE